MKIKRFVDKDMRRVLKRVRDEQGADSVILSNRRVAEGIEVIAAIDYDEALMQHAVGQEAATAPATSARQRKDAGNAAELPAGKPPREALAATADVADDRYVDYDSDTDTGTDNATGNGTAAAQSDDAAEEAVYAAEHEAREAREAARAAVALQAANILAAREAQQEARAEAATIIAPPAAREPVEIEHINVAPVNPPGSDLTLASMRAEISDLRGLLETQVSGLLWADGNRRSPMLSQILRNLARMGVAPDIAKAIIARLGPVEDLKNIWQQPLTALAKLLPVTNSTLLADGGVVALIGPTGAGKTTTIAKLAASYAVRHGTDDIALVCADAYRIGAREHLTAFASILGVKVFVANGAADLPRLLAQLARKKLVLIDTEGLGQRDADLAERLAGWRRNSDAVKFYLTLSASSQEAALDETLRAFKRIPLAGAIATRIDEAGQLGCVMSALIRHQLPLAWLTDGQNIPDDLHAADRHKVWLLQRAVDCINRSEPRIDEHLMAENYGTVSAIHA